MRAACRTSRSAALVAVIAAALVLPAAHGEEEEGEVKSSDILEAPTKLATQAPTAAPTPAQVAEQALGGVEWSAVISVDSSADQSTVEAIMLEQTAQAQGVPSSQLTVTATPAGGGRRVAASTMTAWEVSISYSGPAVDAVFAAVQSARADSADFARSLGEAFRAASVEWDPDSLVLAEPSRLEATSTTPTRTTGATTSTRTTASQSAPALPAGAAAAGPAQATVEVVLVVLLAAFAMLVACFLYFLFISYRRLKIAVATEAVKDPVALTEDEAIKEKAAKPFEADPEIQQHPPLQQTRSLEGAKPPSDVNRFMVSARFLLGIPSRIGVHLHPARPSHWSPSGSVQTEFHNAPQIVSL